jgi:hypothetical protein
MLTIPTNRFQVGERLLPAQLMMPMTGGLRPAGIAKRTPYVRPGYFGWGIARSAMNAQVAIARGMRM